MFEAQKRYQKTEKGKKANRKACQKYEKTKKGKKVRLKSQMKYQKTENGKEKRQKTQMRYRKTEKAKLEKRKHNLKRNFNITIEQYDEMFERQNGICAICNQVDITGRRLAVDHNHKTGEIRGLLCGRCNLLLGILENEDWRPLAEKYLKSSLTSE